MSGFNLFADEVAYRAQTGRQAPGRCREWPNRSSRKARDLRQTGDAGKLVKTTLDT